MESEVLGEGEPEHAVIFHVHGDEPAGGKAVERLKESDIELLKPLKLVEANPQAAEEGVRYIDTDLNRVFPGDPDSDLLEERLASRIIDELEGFKVLNIHSTRSSPTPFCNLKEADREKAKWVGIEKFAVFEDGNGSAENYLDSVLLEVGPQGSDKAAEQAFEVLMNFLSYHGIVDGEVPEKEVEFYRIFEKVEGGDYVFTGENFSIVERGEKYAERSGEDVLAEESFYPVLMSTNGYDDMLGFKAEKME